MEEYLKITGITKDFGGLRALDNVNLNIKKGIIFGLIGPNGSGKTTLINIISGFIKPSQGNIYYKNSSIINLKPHEIAEKGIARTFQIDNLFYKLTVLDNIISSLYLQTKSNLVESFFQTKSFKLEEKEVIYKAKETLKYVGLSHVENLVANNLSSGEQKILALAIAMSCEPEILLLDEPAGGMNPSEVNDLRDLIKSIADKGITILLVEHNMRFVMNICTEIAVLNFGKIIAEGSPQEITNNVSVISAYLGKGKKNA